jgi:hypothetical protein
MIEKDKHILSITGISHQPNGIECVISNTDGRVVYTATIKCDRNYVDAITAIFEHLTSSIDAHFSTPAPTGLLN